jgi:formylglycine-generating enzyme required for sulfatase activity
MKDKHISSVRVIRGGSWYDAARGCRSAVRFDNPAVNCSGILGFRIVFKRGERK